MSSKYVKITINYKKERGEIMETLVEKYYERIGNNVYQFRTTKRMTQYELAEESKVSGAYISQIERADLHKGVTCTAIFQIAAALNIAPCVLLAEEPCPKYADCLSHIALMSHKRAERRKRTEIDSEDTKNSVDENAISTATPTIETFEK